MYKTPGFSGLSPARFLSQVFQFHFMLGVYCPSLAKLLSAGICQHSSGWKEGLTRTAGVLWQ